jgi:hypothetical protein
MRQNLFDSEFKDCKSSGKVSGSYDMMSGAGALSLLTETTYFTSTGANALTLADGVDGQIKRVVLAVNGGSPVITPANFAGAAPVSATIQLTAAGSSVTFQFMQGQWWVIASWSQAVIAAATVVPA